MSKAIDLIIVGFGTFAGLAMIMWALGQSVDEKRWQQKTVAAGCAQYNPQTGEFEWLEKDNE